MVRIWVIRAGERNRLADDFLAAGVIGLGFKEVGSVASLTKEQIAEELRAWLSKGIDGHVKRLWAFVHDVVLGDIVIMPDSPELLIGRVTGDYYFVDDIDGEAYRHRRPVTWTHRVDATDLPAGHTDLYRRRQTLTERTHDTLAAFLATLDPPSDDQTGADLIGAPNHVAGPRGHGRPSRSIRHGRCGRIGSVRSAG